MRLGPPRYSCRSESTINSDSLHWMGVIVPVPHMPQYAGLTYTQDHQRVRCHHGLGHYLYLTFATFWHLDLLKSNVRLPMKSYSFHHVGGFSHKEQLGVSRETRQRAGTVLEGKEKNADSFELWTAFYTIRQNKNVPLMCLWCDACLRHECDVNPTAGYSVRYLN